eukprot:jgi/Bigna1/130213/aug1.10_g4921
MFKLLVFAMFQDFEGQKLADKLHQIITAAFGHIVCAQHKYIISDNFIRYISMVGLCISAIICVPDWGFLNKNPLKWQKPLSEEGDSVDTDEKEENEGEAATQAPKPKTKKKSSGKGGKSKKTKR